VLLGDDEWPLPKSSVAMRNDFRRIERLPRPHPSLVPVKVGHVVRRQKDGVVAFLVQLAVGAVDHLHVRHARAAFEGEALDGEDMALALNRRRRFLRDHTHRDKNQQSERESSNVEHASIILHSF
jgi:hypothetical protein